MCGGKTRQIGPVTRDRYQAARCGRMSSAICLPVARPSRRPTTRPSLMRTSEGNSDTSSSRASSGLRSTSTSTTRRRRFCVTLTQATRLSIRREAPDCRLRKNRRVGSGIGWATVRAVWPVSSDVWRTVTFEGCPHSRFSKRHGFGVSPGRPSGTPPKTGGSRCPTRRCPTRRRATR